MRVKSGVTAVSSSGTPVRLRNTKELVQKIYISTAGNSGLMYFGDSTVEGSGTVSGLVIATTQSPQEIIFESATGGGVEFNVLYVDAATSGDDLYWLAVLQ